MSRFRNDVQEAEDYVLKRRRSLRYELYFHPILNRPRSTQATNIEEPKKEGHTMNINQLRESRYMKKEDADTGILVTIAYLKEENVAKEDQQPEMKHVLYFEEHDKGLVLNSTNAQLIAAILKSEETDDWTGKQIVLFNDPSVSYAGKITGGIRVRAPRVKKQTQEEEPPF